MHILVELEPMMHEAAFLEVCFRMLGILYFLLLSCAA